MVLELRYSSRLKDLYKTVWEMSMKILSICHVIVYFVDQSIIELVYAKCKLFKIDINAFLCMAVWIENWNVLLENKGGS
jgi:hypothetical protein